VLIRCACYFRLLLLFQIADIARNQWKEVGIYLGFKRHELSGYENKFRDDWDKRLMDVLFDWKDREDNPTIGKVVKACENARKGPAVRRALQKLISGDA
jgi:hypothetical protein